jgi:hypothetical protein
MRNQPLGVVHNQRETTPWPATDRIRIERSSAHAPFTRSGGISQPSGVKRAQHRPEQHGATASLKIKWSVVTEAAPR